MNYKKLNELLYGKAVVFFSSAAFIVLLILWCFFEASFWFLGPDLILLIYFMTVPKNYKKIILITVGSSIAGGIFYFGLNLLWPDLMGTILYSTPLVAVKNINFVQGILLKYGVAGTILQSITIMPFKIWTYLAVQNGFNFFPYIFFAILTRFIRFSILGALFYWIGTKKNLIKNHYVLWIILFLIGFFTLIISVES